MRSNKVSITTTLYLAFLKDSMSNDVLIPVGNIPTRTENGRVIYQVIAFHHADQFNNNCTSIIPSCRFPSRSPLCDDHRLVMSLIRIYRTPLSKTYTFLKFNKSNLLNYNTLYSWHSIRNIRHKFLNVCFGITCLSPTDTSSGTKDLFLSTLSACLLVLPAR